MSTQKSPTPPKPRLRFRQVHLDFHTSPLIPGVGADFDPDAFARTLTEAHIDSITCFAVCHHGMFYYPTKVGQMHPHLQRDLLGEQIAACHQHGIRVPAYITVVWNEHQANLHPEWRQIAPDGRPAGRRPLELVGKTEWQWLCMNSPYADHVATVVDEVLRTYPVDGLFMDIVMTVKPGCVCRYCLAEMREQGLNPERDEDLQRHALAVERRFMARISNLAWSLRPDLPVFYNSRLRLAGDPQLGNRPETPYFSHWEIESLPSGGWGYTHFSLYARYFQTLGKPMLGMTGAFHRSWADFGTVKGQAALDYECFRALALGAQCSIGDQMHPRGVLNPETYRRIGRTYAQVEAKEPWCRDATPLAEIGLLLPHDLLSGTRALGLDSESGALHLLLELGMQVAVIDADADFSAYRVLVAPDTVRLDNDLATRLRAYLTAGGALILSHEAGLTLDGSAFVLAQELGLEYLGPSRDDVEFLRPVQGLEREVPAMDHVLYERGSAVRAWEGTTVLGELIPPYFSRTWEHFNSHAQTPPDPTAPHDLAALTIRGRVAYVSHPIFRAYHLHGYPVYREIIAALLRRLLPDPLVRVEAPTTAEVTLLRQQAPAGDLAERLICHILHYVPQRRTPDLDLVEDVIPLYDVSLAVRTGWTPSAAYLAPQHTALPVTMNDGYAQVRVPRIDGHAMVVLER
jgi:hypothetical protein